MKKLILTLIIAASSSTAFASGDKWVCDSGFKFSLGGAYISELHRNSSGKYDLYVGSSPSDVGLGKVVEPILIESDLKCLFSEDNNGVMLNCSASSVSGWSSMTSSLNTAKSLHDNGKTEAYTYVEVIFSSDKEDVNQRIGKVTGGDSALQYNVVLDLPNTKCGF